MFLLDDCLCLSSKIMNNETVMWITNDCGVNDETLYYLYYVDNAEFSDNRFSLYMTRGISLTVSLVRSVFLVCPICIISLQEAEWAGSGVQGERHEHRGEEQRGRGERGEEAVKEKPDQSEHSEVRSEQRGGGVTDCRYCGKLGRQALLASSQLGARFLGNWKLIHSISVKIFSSIDHNFVLESTHWLKTISRLNTMRGGGRPNQERKSIVKKTESDSRLDGEKYWMKRNSKFKYTHYLYVRNDGKSSSSSI